MSEERMDEILGRVRDVYHAPPETPREEMWQVIAARIEDERMAETEPDVVDLGRVRASRTKLARSAWWGTAAAAVAAALVVMGVGIGRMTGPGGLPAPVADGVPVARGTRMLGRALGVAAQEHFGRTESLLTMVRADARAGDLDPATTAWAHDLLVETRLLLDARGPGDREVDLLLEDLELVLAQIVGAGELEGSDDSRARTELQLAMRGLEDGEVLPRIRAALPTMQAGA